MNRRLRTMLLATVLLIAPGIGQFVTIRDLNTLGHPSQLSLLFAMTALFLVPTSLILTSVIMYTLRKAVTEHKPLILLGILNLIIALNLIWFFLHPCSWALVFGLTLHTCSG